MQQVGALPVAVNKIFHSGGKGGKERTQTHGKSYTNRFLLCVCNNIQTSIALGKEKAVVVVVVVVVEMVNGLFPLTVSTVHKEENKSCR